MSFSVQLGAFAEKSTARVDNIRRAIVLKLFSAVIQDTPVLTGRLRGNWQTSLRYPLLGQLPVRSPDAAINEIRSASSALTGDDDVYFRNNLPYVNRIEFDGWSHTKAPAGMVRKNIARITGLVNAAIREGKL